MPIAKSNGKTVLVTGINGFIASVLGLNLLSKGYILRETSRRAASANDRVKIYKVPDMTIDGAFDEAAKGVNGIFHTALPIDLSLTDYSHFITLAIIGNEVILESARKAGPQLLSVVITSLVAAIFDGKKPAPYVFTEAGFARSSLEKGKRIGKRALKRIQVYCIVRVRWRLREQFGNRGTSRNLTSQSQQSIPPSISSPVYLPSSGSQLNKTLKPLFDIFSRATKTIRPPFGSGGFVDAAADVLRREYKGTSIGERIPVGEPGVGYQGYNSETGRIVGLDYPKGKLRVSGEKATRIAGLQYIDFKRSILDTAKALEALL